MVRKQSERDIYHVIARGTGRQLIFEDDEDCRFFMRLLARALRLSKAELYAWCLMGNHVHLLVHAPIESLSLCMKRLLETYATRFNEKTGRTGHLFQGKFKSEPILDDAYLLTVIRYIHNNPVKAGFASMENYPWSSYGEYVGSPQICNTEFPLAVFGGVEAFVRFHRSEAVCGECMDVDNLRNATKPMPDKNALAIARRVTGNANLSDIKTLPVSERRERLCEMKAAGLSVRQIERLTGIGRNTVARA